jgi:hypothetical protein
MTNKKIDPERTTPVGGDFVAVSPGRSLEKEPTKTADQVGSPNRGNGGMPSEDLRVAPQRPELAGAGAYNPTVIEDLRFLDAWERGLIPSLSAHLRARQIRRANPVRTVETR